VVLAAWRGRKEDALRLIDAGLAAVEHRGEGIGVTVMHWVSAILHNGLGEYEDALAAARQASAFPEEVGLSTWGLPELIEAAARSDRRELAAPALARLADATRASGTEWALGIEARSRALLSEGTTADALFCEAIARLSGTRVHAELARARLVYGEWLRRAGRRRDAYEQLGAAHELFSTMGLEAFAARAARELQGGGATARRRGFQHAGRLTSREAQIAQLARDGLSNPEIGARLFISPRTVEHHLSSVFGKLGIGSRHELHSAVSPQWR
jgi:DNA-binding CsgD family transcriptional regulator